MARCRIVITCALTKIANAGFLRDRENKKLDFVADPSRCNGECGHKNATTPDGCDKNGASWRERLINYNDDFQRTGKNLQGLLQAIQLYRPPVYSRLSKCQDVAVYIHSAGWGLVRSDFLLPQYDITFSKKAPACTRRGLKNTGWNDYNHLAEDISKESELPIHFFGGKDYLQHFYQLTKGLGAEIYVHHKVEIEKYPGYKYITYQGKISTNWHYTAAQDFLYKMGVGR